MPEAVGPWIAKRPKVEQKERVIFVYFASPEIIEVKFCYRQTDKFFDTISGGMWIFSSS